MTDLYMLNELEENEKKPPKHTYQNTDTISSTVNLFIKAINKALAKITASEALLDEIGDPRATALERDNNQTKALVEFVSNLNLAGKIVTEFHKSTSVIPHDLADLESLFEMINNTFFSVEVMINLFSITKNPEYATSSKELLINILKMFEQIKESISS